MVKNIKRVGSSGYRFKSWIYLHSMTHIVQYCVVDGLPDVPHRPLHVGWSDDLMSPWCVLICCQDANLSPGDLLLMDVYRLIKSQDKNKRKDWQQCPETQSMIWLHACHKAQLYLQHLNPFSTLEHTKWTMVNAILLHRGFGDKIWYARQSDRAHMQATRP